MPMLDASLAFALTMLGLASVATLLVEIFHRLARLRSKGLRTMLNRLFDTEVEPWIKANEAKLDSKLSELKQAFVQQMLHNRLVKEAGYQQPLQDLEEMSSEDFLRRLGETDVGKKLRLLAEDKEQELGQQIDRWALRFEQFGAATSDYFARRAKVLALLAGIALAFLGNINALRIADTYLRNPEAVQAIITTQSARLPKQWQATEQQLAQALADLEKPGQQQDAIKEIKAQVTQVDTRLAELSGAGVPLGYDRYPVPSGQRAILWFLSVLLTGILLGLGGPFWFDLVVRLNQIRQILGGVSTPAPATNPGILPPAADNSAGTAKRIALVQGIPYPT